MDIYFIYNFILYIIYFVKSKKYKSLILEKITIDTGRHIFNLILNVPNTGQLYHKIEFVT